MFNSLHYAASLKGLILFLRTFLLLHHNKFGIFVLIDTKQYYIQKPSAVDRILSLPNVHVEALSPNVMVLESEAFGR